MSSISLKSKSPFNDLIKKVEQLSTPDLEAFASQVLSLKTGRKTPDLRLKEIELLKKINEPISAELKSRFDVLTVKMRAGTLTDPEYQELLSLSDAIEGFDLNRVTLFSELAQLQGISMRELMGQLGMKPPFDV